LDIVEVARSHTGAVLANEFMKVLENFGVVDKGLGVEDYETISAISTDPDVDDVDGSVDKIIDMDVEDRANLEQSIQPVRMALTKIHKLAFKIINSLTVLLPAWDTACKEAGLSMKQIPRDVSTWWNLSFNMVDFIVDYHVPVDAVTNKRRLGLGNYALNEHEWKVLEQL
ncbi:hypothetical protein SCLCIDRAFT_130856, partial [Scleroderma citrinum Foug A]